MNQTVFREHACVFTEYGLVGEGVYANAVEKLYKCAIVFQARVGAGPGYETGWQASE